MANSSFFSQTGSNSGTISTVQSKVDDAEAAKVAAEAARDAAEGYRDTAETHKDDASAAQTAAEAARDTANNHKTAAEGFKDDAEGFKDNASASATSAASSESDAEDAKADAEKLAVNAEDTQYTLSDGSTTGYSALHYAAKAEDHKTAAETAETNAETAETDAVAAKNDAVTAKNDAVTAKNNAETAETNAETAQTAAETARDTAQDHRDDAEKLATHAEDSQYTLADGTTTGYSALHYKEKAADSATAAASSASTASTKAGEASTDASTATTKATEASNSASSAATAQTAAEAARDSALAALDSFDDRYLGSKSSAPTVDNDGDALVSGALYFDTTDDAMKVYDGTQWLNAYASLSGALIANQNLSDLTNAGTARTNLGISTVGNTGAFSDLTGTPTTISGYGITDAFDGAFSSLTGTPTTVSGYGITDVPDDLTDLGITDGTNGQALKTDGSGNFSFGDVATSTAWADITSKPTTISGFGITDAFDGAYSSLTGTPTIPTAVSDLTNDSGFITSADGGNATTLDGIDSGSFLRSDANDTMTGTLTMSNKSIDFTGSDQAIRMFNGSGGNAHQRADCRDDGTNSRIHWYGVNDSNGTSNFRHAWYTGGQYVNVTAGTSVAGNHGVEFDGNLSITKNAPKLELDSSSSGSNTNEQSATISLGESGAEGSASLHLAYTGDGYSYIGMGNLGSDNIPDYRAMRFYYTNDNVHFYDSLTCAGNITAYSSDRRLKENIQTIDNAMDMVGRLRGVTFDWKDGLEELGFSPDMKTETGLIAQELQEVIPDAVVPAPFDHDESGSISGENYLTVKPEKVIPVLIEAIKELKAEIEELKKG